MEFIGRPTNVFPLNCGLRRIGGRPIEIVIAFYMIDHLQKWRLSLFVVHYMAPVTNFSWSAADFCLFHTVEQALY